MKRNLLLSTFFAIISTAYSQNVGIGTSAPVEKLHVLGNVMLGSGTNTYFSSPTGTAALTLNGSTSGGLLRMVMNDGSGTFNQYQNAYFDGTNHKYNASAEATCISSSMGAFTFSVAPTGTAGNNISWNNVLRLSNNGNVGIGTTTPAQKLDIFNGNLLLSNSGTPGQLSLQGTGAGVTNIVAGAQGAANITYVLPSTQATQPGLALVNDGQGNLSWADPTASDFFSQASAENYEDFIFDAYAGNGSNDNQYSFTQAGTNISINDVDGTAANYTSFSGGNDYVGIHHIRTATNATAVGGIGSFNNVNKLKLGGRQVAYEIRVRAETLSDANGNFIALFGMCDLNDPKTTNNPANGVYFTYNHAVNSGNWTATTRSSNTSTDINTGVAVVANQWYKLRVVVNAAGNKVDFYIDNNLVGTSTTNIPSSAMKFIFRVQKTAGTQQRSVSIDYFVFKMIR